MTENPKYIHRSNSKQMWMFTLMTGSMEWWKNEDKLNFCHKRKCQVSPGGQYRVHSTPASYCVIVNIIIMGQNFILNSSSQFFVSSWIPPAVQCGGYCSFIFHPF